MTRVSRLSRPRCASIPEWRGFRAAAAALLLAAWAPAVSAEPLQLLDMDGRRHDADALIESGHSVVLVFWQTWCGTCKREAPELARAVKEYGESIRFFGVVSGPDGAIDDEQVRRVAQEWGHRQPQIRDRDLVLTKRFGVYGTPVVIVLGPGGRELYHGFRLPKDWDRFVLATEDVPDRELP